MVDYLHVTVEVIKKTKILLMETTKEADEKWCKTKTKSLGPVQVLLLAFAVDSRLHLQFVWDYSCVSRCESHGGKSDGSYLEYVSLVEAEFITLCGTKCVKCHCFHSENSKHTHTCTHTLPRRQSRTPADAPAGKGGVDQGKVSWIEKKNHKINKVKECKGTGEVRSWGEEREVSSVGWARELREWGRERDQRGKETRLAAAQQRYHE